MEGTSRPVLACLDTPEIRDAAAGLTEDPAIVEHLARCDKCRRTVHELRGDLRRPTRPGGASHRRSLLSRPGFWLLLVVLALLAFGWVVLVPRKPPQPEQATTTSDPQPVVAPAQRPPVRRARPRRSAGSSMDAQIVAVIRSNQTGIRMCYERALKRDPRLSLALDVRVNVSSAGVVERVSLDGLPDAGLLATCIRSAIKTWQFPRAPAAYETAFPLRLEKSP